MLRRLLFTLMLACLALPAMEAKACEGQATATHAMPMHHAPEQQAPVQQHHDCIGCIAPLNINLYRPVCAPEFGSGTPARIHNVVAHFIAPAAPEPPPPRSVV